MDTKIDGRFTGRVIKYNVERGFGFIEVNDRTFQQDAFIHFSEIDKGSSSFKKLLPDQAVEFSLVKNDRGLVATDLKRCEG